MTKEAEAASKNVVIYTDGACSGNPGKGGYGAVDWGTMMAMLVLAIVPIIIFYAACQKYIIEGVVAGAVKG